MFPLARISQRVSMEVFNALYGQQSTCKCDSKDGNDVRNEIYDVDIGVGLFSTISFNTGDVIAEFHGEVISREESVKRVKEGNGNYMLYLTKQTYLDCRSNRFAGKCKASLANSPLHCWNFQLQIKPLDEPLMRSRCAT
jgi:hypothetical protein